MLEFIIKLVTRLLGQGYDTVASLAAGFTKGLFKSWLEARNEPRKVMRYGPSSKRVADLQEQFDRARRQHRSGK